MIETEEYFRGFADASSKYRKYYDIKIHNAAIDLLDRVNPLLEELFPGKVFTVSSGWRPPPFNKQVGGSHRSWHLFGRAVDLHDPDGSLDIAIAEKPSILSKFGLWCEHMNATPGWVHLDTGDRKDREIRIFRP